MRLPELVPEVIRLDGDLLWREEYWGDATRTRDFYKTWLRLAAAIAENGRSLVFCGVVTPNQWEPVGERERLGDIHYVALVCAPDVHAERLQARGPAFQDDRIPKYLNHNRWLQENAASTDPPMDVIDTTSQSPNETAAALAAWIRSRL